LKSDPAADRLHLWVISVGIGTSEIGLLVPSIAAISSGAANRREVPQADIAHLIDAQTGVSDPPTFGSDAEILIAATVS
jgi:hypothetical protein